MLYVVQFPHELLFIEVVADTRRKFGKHNFWITGTNGLPTTHVIKIYIFLNSTPDILRYLYYKVLATCTMQYVSKYNSYPTEMLPSLIITWFLLFGKPGSFSSPLICFNSDESSTWKIGCLDHPRTGYHPSYFSNKSITDQMIPTPLK